MRIYTPLTEEHKNVLSQRAFERARAKYPIGIRLRKLTVIGYMRMVCPTAKTARSYWAVRCKCDCGKETVVRASTLTGKGKSESCGCEGIRKRTEASRRVWTLPPGEAAARSAFANFKAQAFDRKYCVSISFDQFRIIAQQPCHYCGAPPSKRYGSTSKGVPRLNGIFVYNGIDRLDSSQGYALENCVACCTCCNYAKHLMSIDEFRTWLRRAAMHFLGLK